MTQFDLFSAHMGAIKTAAGLSDQLTNLILESVHTIYEADMENDLDEDETEGTNTEVENGITEDTDRMDESGDGNEPAEVTEDAIRELIDGLGELEDEEELSRNINEIRELIGELPEPADEDEKDARINLLTDFMDTLIASNDEAEDEKAIVESNRYEQYLAKNSKDNEYLDSDDYDSRARKRKFRDDTQYAGGEGSDQEMLQKSEQRHRKAYFNGKKDITLVEKYEQLERKRKSMDELNKHYGRHNTHVHRR